MLEVVVEPQVEPSNRMLFSRYRDGARPVRIVEGGWQVAKDGEPTTFRTAQGLLAELTGHPEGRHWSLDRYFSMGRHAPTVATVGGRVRADQLIGRANILDLFPLADPPSHIVLLEPLAPPLLAFRSNTPDPAISVPGRVRGTRRTPGLVISGPVGIDLVNRSHEVRKLLFAGFGRRIFSAGYDPDDVLQEVYKGLLARNKGKCPWDPNKSSFGHYVYMVCGCVLSNYHRKQRRMRQFEQSGLLTYLDGVRQYTDAAANTSIPAPEAADLSCYLLNEVADDLVDYMLSLPRGSSTDARLAVDVLPYVAGATTPRALIATTLEVSMAAVSRAISFLRKSARAWHQGLLHH